MAFESAPRPGITKRPPEGNFYATTRHPTGLWGRGALSCDFLKATFGRNTSDLCLSRAAMSSTMQAIRNRFQTSTASSRIHFWRSYPFLAKTSAAKPGRGPGCDSDGFAFPLTTPADDGLILKIRL